MTPCQIAPSSGPLPPQSLKVISRSSPSDLTFGWAPAPGQQEGYKLTWHQDGTQGSPGNLVDLGPNNSSLTLKSLVPGSCYTVSAWAWAGNLRSSLRKIHGCTREFLPCAVRVVCYPLQSALLSDGSENRGLSCTFYLLPCDLLVIPTHPCAPTSGHLSMHPSILLSILLTNTYLVPLIFRYGVTC